MPASCSSSASSTSSSASALSKYRRQARSRSGEGLDKDCSSCDSSLCNCSTHGLLRIISAREEGSEHMTTVAPERGTSSDTRCDDDEGEAFWLLGMLQTIKIGRDDTDGAVRPGRDRRARGRRLALACSPRGGRVVLRPRGRAHLLGRRHSPVPQGRLVRLRPEGRAAHLLRRGRRSEGAGRLRADAVRGIPARSR